MTRAERRRMERETGKQKPTPTSNIPSSTINTALYKQQLTEQIDRELSHKYYQQACKESCDNTYYIMLCSMALALHDCNPQWSCEPIARRLQLTMDYVDKFSKEYDGDIEAYLQRVEDETGLKITVDSKSKEDEL